MYKDYRNIDSGYAKSGVHWNIDQYKLRFAVLYRVVVNGRETQFSTLSECYDHLNSTGVQSFRKVMADGKASYAAYEPEEAKDGDVDTVPESGK